VKGVGVFDKVSLGHLAVTKVKVGGVRADFPRISHASCKYTYVMHTRDLFTSLTSEIAKSHVDLIIKQKIVITPGIFSDASTNAERRP